MKTLTLALFTVAALTAAEPATTAIGSLRLLDGRALNNVVVRSYDAQASKVLVLADGKMMLIPINLIPPPHAERILAETKRTAPESVQTTPAPQTPAPAQPGSSTTSPGVPVPTPFQPSAPTRPAPAPTAPPASVATQADLRKAHQAAAAAHARRYYKYEYRTGSNAIAVTDSDIAFDKTEPVPGWANRYRTTGKVFLEIYDSVGGGSFRRSTSKFEILTEQKPGEDIEVVDFTRK